MASSAREQHQNIDSLSDPFARNALRVAYHVRKYSVLYVCGALGAIALALFPTYTGSTGGNQSVAEGQGIYGNKGAGGQGGGALNGTSTVTSGTGAPAGAGATAASGSAGAGKSGSPGSQAGAAVTTAASGTSGASNQVLVGRGVTRGGFTCAPGVRQLPFSVYADPCVAKYTGSNGGSTWNGVTAKTITIAIRHTSDSTGANEQATNAESEAAGGQTYETSESYIKAVTAYLNKTIELYGRQVKLVDYSGQGNYTNEELDTGQAAACADADAEATSVHAFMGVDFEGLYEWGPFAECAARYKMMTPQGAPYFPESYYKKYDPYVWATTMNCSMIADEVGEFIGKQIAPFPAKFAGTDGATNLQNAPRKFGTYVPNNAEYQECVNQTLQIDENQYHVAKNREDQYNYALDISQFPNDTQRAAIQFAANKDTTIVLACDPISPIFLTKDAFNQGYHPEWLIIGVAFDATDNWAQLWDQDEVNGHLFGLSQAASTDELLNPNGEAGKALKAAGVPFNITSVTDYYEMLSIFDQLQAAGPDLTPANVAAGTHGLPVGGPGAFGTWYYGQTHTAIVDSREVYWLGNQTSKADGRPGTYVPIYKGKRFRAGQFPTGQPPFYQ